jgi:DNA-binding CsgD family transcriptional regulator
MMSSIVDKIYESAFLPGGWDGVLEAMAADVKGLCGVMYVVNSTDKLMTRISSESLRPLFERFVAEGWALRDGKMERVLASGNPGFLCDRDLFSPAELRRSECHALFMRPNQLGDGAGMAVALPTGDLVGVGVHFRLADGPTPRKAIRRLDALRPHLARAALVAARLQLEQARAMSQALEAFGLPALVFDHAGKVLAPNALIQALSDHVAWRAGDRFALRAAPADAQFEAARAAIASDEPGPPRSFAVPGATLVGHVVPIRRSARDIFSRCAGVLILTPATLPQAPPAELIQSLFDLTPAEARVARAMAGGASVEEIARSAGVSVNTVRTQVRILMAKTGCHRQAEVVGLLAGLSVVRPPADGG